jgi:hypothetical protein
MQGAVVGFDGVTADGHKGTFVALRVNRPQIWGVSIFCENTKLRTFNIWHETYARRSASRHPLKN